MEVQKATILRNINLLINKVEKMSNKDIVKLEKELNNINPEMFEEEIKTINQPELNSEHVKNRLSHLSFKLKLKTLFLNPKAKRIITILCKLGLALLVMNYLPSALTFANSKNAFLYVDALDTTISGFNNVDSSALLTIGSSILSAFTSVTQVFTIILSAILIYNVFRAVVNISKYIINSRDLKENK